MFSFIMENLGTVVIGLVVAGIVTAIVVKIIFDMRRGKHAGCGCGCGGCSKATIGGIKQ